DERSVRERVELGSVAALTILCAVPALLVQRRVDVVRLARGARMDRGPRSHERLLVPVRAQPARTVARRERGGLVEEEQLGEPARLHQRLAAPTPEFQPTG